MPIAIAILEDWFDRITDEVEWDQFLSADKAILFAQAERILFNKLYHPKKKGIEAQEAYFESSMPVSQYLSPFSKQLSGTLAVAGELPFSTLTGIAGREIGYITKLLLSNPGGTTGYRPAKWISTGEIEVQEDLSFYEPSVCNPKFQFREDKIYIYSGGSFGVLFDYRVDVLLLPLDPAGGSEFGEVLAPWIVFKAAELAGISVRDTEFAKEMKTQLEIIGV